MARDDPPKPPPTWAVPDAERKSRPPTSRLGRLVRLGALATRGIPIAVEGARRVLAGNNRSEQDQADSRERMLTEARKTAHAMLKTLGDMKGVPLKLGQMVSYIDGIAPPGYEDKVQRVLQKLQEKAPPLSAEAAARVVKEELGQEPEQVFARWEREPFAAASIGQVHEAVTKGGDRVAVKVQYPGIDRALENDLKSLSLLEAFASPALRKYQTKETLEEIRTVFMSELDYTREAQMADVFRRMNRDLDRVVVPRVFHSLSTRRVLVTELMSGRGYQDYCSTASQEERNVAGVTIWQFMFRSLLRHGMLYADPHPGNYKFLDDGRVAFLDYGCVKELPETLVSGMKRYLVAAIDRDWPSFDRALVEVLGLDSDDKDAWQLYRSYLLELLLPITTHGTFRWSPEVAREAVAFLVRGHRDIMFEEGGSKIPRLPRPVHMPPEATFINRLQWGLASVMGGLRSEGTFRDLTEPWVRNPKEPIPA